MVEKWLRNSLLVFMTIMVVNTCVFTQCNTSYNQSQSLKIANYDIEVHLDHKGKSASCIQKLNWKNTSPDTLRELRFYMYMNAFKDLKSTYLKNTRKMFEDTGTVGSICRDYCIQNGLVMRAVRDGMIFCPPLIFTKDNVDELVDKLKKSLDQTHSHISKS